MLGSDMVELENLHQSLSDRYACNEETIERLLLAGERIVATQVALVFGRLVSSPGINADFHRTLRTRGRPDEFDQLVESVQVALRSVGMGKPANNTPHMTTSYRARANFPTRLIRPFEWNIDKVLLVEGGGRPYRYKIHGEWHLLPHPQMALGF